MKLLLSSEAIQDASFLFEGYDFATIGLDYKIYDTEWIRGITYFFPEGQYDIHLNKVGWARILISYKDGSYKDLPFNDSTIALLPKSITVRKIYA